MSSATGTVFQLDFGMLLNQSAEIGGGRIQGSWRCLLLQVNLLSESGGFVDILLGYRLLSSVLIIEWYLFTCASVTAAL